MVGALGLHAGAPGSNPVQASGLDLFPVVPDSTLPRFVNGQLFTSCQLGSHSLTPRAQLFESRLT